MAHNDPTNTGGLFVGRRPGTAPLRYRVQPKAAGERSRRRDSILAGAILALETLVLLTIWGPQPAGWLWVGSQVDYLTGSVEAGITVAFAGMVTTLMLTVALAKRIDHWWKLVRRAAGHEQRNGAIERIFVVSIAIGVSIFLVWFFVIQGPGSMIFPAQPQ
ncbi:MAG TPA: hypothetical protein VGR10_03975 [Thermoleophilaceae bacterium]|nr:hypothetical protein [Thermoleophilaceae bacterium]